MLLAIDRGRPAHLVAGHEVLLDLDVSDQVRLGALADEDGALHPATYRQFSDAHQVMVHTFDPTPVPSFKGSSKRTEPPTSPGRGKVSRPR